MHEGEEGQEGDPGGGYFGAGSEPLRTKGRRNLDPSQSFFSFLGSRSSKEELESPGVETGSAELEMSKTSNAEVIHGC